RGRGEDYLLQNTVGVAMKMNHALFCPRGGKAVTKDTDARGREAALRLRTLELQGFKSFPDHTVLTFDHPVTAIVGPNGSGKSNLSDAICCNAGSSCLTLRGTRWRT
ncbi:MAG: AAA family ATPase, partial [Evtepia sp.]